MFVFVKEVQDSMECFLYSFLQVLSSKALWEIHTNFCLMTMQFIRISSIGCARFYVIILKLKKEYGFLLENFQPRNTGFYPLNQGDIFTSCYFHTVKVSKVLFLKWENYKQLRRHVMYSMQCLRFESLVTC